MTHRKLWPGRPPRPRRRRLPGLWAALFCALLAAPAHAQQRSDPDFRPEIAAPRFEAGAGPVVAIDAAHENFHTGDGRYAPFAALLAADGYRVRAGDTAFSADALAGIDVLVVANALHPSNVGNWRLPVASAFTAAEIAAVRAWVEGGGRLLLIADHMPFAGAAAELAAAFGFGFQNGFAVEMIGRSTRFAFTPALGLHLPAAVFAGLDPPVDRFVTFTGQAFSVPDGAVSLLTLEGPHVVLLPQEAWKFSPQTPRKDVSGWSQGAIMEVGAGRIAVFGEAGAFSAQIGQNGRKFGMNAPDAADNARFILAVMAWLAG